LSKTFAPANIGRVAAVGSAVCHLLALANMQCACSTAQLLFKCSQRVVAEHTAVFTAHFFDDFFEIVGQLQTAWRKFDQLGAFVAVVDLALDVTHTLKLAHKLSDRLLGDSAALGERGQVDRHDADVGEQRRVRAADFGVAMLAAVVEYAAAVVVRQTEQYAPHVGRNVGSRNVDADRLYSLLSHDVSPDYFYWAARGRCCQNTAVKI